ncbi:hypothetical protein IM793_23655 [Pedobacter sp. MR2016-19]|uniref:ABC-three component system protein n=1 Tax=Pedobacter sp. MR2016-19 TaxID=2780089 RepID=UPI0018736E22|nr:ABC-three component system protein [Pedobacter sp. MR2016-19]MBE5322169.1 hypothetical protein [Pedobacter sp. MR2016-19]
MLTELPLTQPALVRRISALEALQGAIVPALSRVELMSSDDYEVFVLEWVFGFLDKKYAKTRSFAGAGDKGRDVVGYYDDGSIDIYQCKHYDNKVSPTTLYPELGKLCYYTFKKQYPIPKQYFIVAPKGCGPAILDFIDNPETINQKLIENWEDYCLKKITKTEDVILTDEFRKYIEDFDFSIIRDLAPHEIIDQHKATAYHTLRFGGGIKKYRDVIPAPDLTIQPREQNYTELLFKVYEQELNLKIACVDDLKDKGKYFTHFNTQRNSFYSAESLEKFSRENFPESTPPPFEDLLDDAFSVLTTTLELHLSDTGYTRILIASQEIKRQSFTSNPLSIEVKPLDKDGLCNHLANENRINWIVS